MKAVAATTLTATEKVRTMAAAEGLSLVAADNFGGYKSSYKGVYRDRKKASASRWS